MDIRDPGVDRGRRTTEEGREMQATKEIGEIERTEIIVPITVGKKGTLPEIADTEMTIRISD